MEAPAAGFCHPLVGVCDSQQRLCQALGELDARALGPFRWSLAQPRTQPLREAVHGRCR